MPSRPTPNFGFELNEKERALIARMRPNNDVFDLVRAKFDEEILVTEKRLNEKLSEIEKEQQWHHRFEPLLLDCVKQYRKEANPEFVHLFKGFVVCSFPSKDPNQSIWERSTNRYLMQVKGGIDPMTGEFLGVPFGKYSRRILMYITDYAFRNSTREIHFGSVSQMMKALGISKGTKQKQLFEDQLNRLAACSITFTYSYIPHQDHELGFHDNIEFVDDFTVNLATKSYGFWHPSGRHKNTISLTEEFYDYLQHFHCLEPWKDIKAVWNKKLGLDFYLLVSQIWFDIQHGKKQLDFDYPFEKLNRVIGSNYKRARNIKKDIETTIDYINTNPHLKYGVEIFKKAPPGWNEDYRWKHRRELEDFQPLFFRVVKKEDRELVKLKKLTSRRKGVL
jgi:hypothetical protein